MAGRAAVRLETADGLVQSLADRRERRMKAAAPALLVAGAVALLIGLYWMNARPRTYRYRMSVEVETTQGLKTGSAVREVRYVPQPKMTGNRFIIKQRGEAVVVDLPNGQVLFVLLDEGDHTIRAAIGDGTTSDVGSLLDRMAEDRQPHVYPSRAELRTRNLDLPRFVRFSDPSDPRSVQAVDPENLEDSFGSGYRLRRITVEGTSGPLTTNVTTRLGWLSRHPEPRLDSNYRGSAYPNLAQSLSHGDFQRGMK